ncbi:hypothetical protein [Alteraurantiacibacter aquimixticola]|uniref:DUF2306 domain-containing protein n=1 Tax=Alteraurantiacibacter aquimixticola TaxID=2489173 RepID=A0A4V6UGB7_9SPHN|nr:hypothetical protein [Alteraurantiacibacter aquimixticola]TIX51067.1 hypothetical protein E5222_00855 [Alteraurantiacibacter aquimixticola]
MRRFKPSFFFWLALAMCFFVIAGFGIHSGLPALQGNFPPAPPIVHIHAVVFGTWMLLLLAQTGLASTGNVKLHRSLGTWGIAHATAILLIGLATQLIASRAGMDAGRDPGTDGLYLGILAVIGFAIMFTLAIRNVKRPQIHKRMMMFAMLPVLPPGVNRFWSNALGLDDPIPTFWLYLTLWGMAAAILWQERRETGGISRYSLFGAAWIFVEGAIHEAVVGSPWFNEVGRIVLGLAVYR